MNRLAFSMALLCCFLMHRANTQQAEIIRKYIETHKDMAMAEMQRTGVPAAIKLAQGIHETGAGTSPLVKKSNNHFGIKCKTGWQGPSVKHTDDAKNECFRKYSSAAASYRDHSDFLKNSARYASLFQLDPTDYEGWAYGLKKAGYATNPRYAQTLIRLIEDYNLQEYTLIVLGKMKDGKEIFATAIQDADGYASGPAVMQTAKDNKSASDVNVEKSQEQLPELYPQGVFKIHETKVVFVRAGTAYLALAQQYNIPLQRIFEFNEMAPSEAADKGRLIYLQRKRKTGKDDYHIVQPGESLHDIAQLQAIRLEALLEYNWLSAGMQPAPGEKLYLKNKAPGRPRLAANESFSITNFQ